MGAEQNVPVLLKKQPPDRPGQEEKSKGFFARLLRFSRKDGFLQSANSLHLGRAFPADPADMKHGEIDLFMPYEHRGHHLACFGTTGAGKTRLIMHMVTQDILAGLNVLVVDPKGDDLLFGKIVEAAAAAGRLDELIYFSPIFPDFSTRLNLLSYYYMPDELVDHIVSGVKAREEYFVNVAQEVSTAIILGLLALARARGEKFQINFYEVKRWCSYDSLAQLKTSLEYLRYAKDSKVRALAEDVILMIQQILSSPSDFFAKVSSSLRTVLTALSSSAVGEVVGKATYNEFIRRLECGERAVVFCNTGSLMMRRSAHIVGKVLISMIQSTIGRFLASGRKVNPPLVIYLDEGHNVLYRGIEELFNKGRAANVWINFFTQSLAQMEEAVGKEATRSLVDNMSTWAFMRVNHPETAHFVEQAAPIVRVYRKRYIPGGGNILVPISEEEVPAVRGDFLTRMENRRFVFKSVDGKFYYGEIPYVPDPKVRIKFPYTSASNVFRASQTF